MGETVQSIDRAMALLGAIAAQPDNLSGLARRADMPTSTTGRLLATLEQTGSVSRSEEGTYRIGPTIVAMARSAQPLAPSLESAARPHLAALADRTGEAAGLSVPLGDDIHCLAQTDAPKPVQAEDWTGRRWPLHQGGSGIVLLAASGPGRVDHYLAANTSVEPEALRRRVRAAARAGISWSHGDYREGLTSVAAPVLGRDGSPVAALYLYGPSYRFPPDDDDAASRLEALLVEHAGQLAAQLGATST